ncbi:MAG: TcpQ domain-containing protein [Kluyvera sp.]|uniref:TcpQ domain-containing protein n=1 Tax=Kluyvera sp. TaxID=1538228 RepID=UPI003F2EECE5
MINKILLTAIVIAGWSNYATASCSTNNGDCSQYKGTVQHSSKTSDSLWNRPIEKIPDPMVKRTQELTASAKAVAEDALGSTLNRMPDAADVEGIAESWCLTKEMTLSANMTSWVKRAHWSLKWNSDYDYPIDSDFCVSGSFQQAVNTIASSYINAQHVLRLDVYPKQTMIVFSTK